MKRTSFLLALLLVGALPSFAQSTEFGVLVGGSRRFVDAGPREQGVEFDDSTFSFSNNTFDLYWALQIEPDVWIKFKGGRMETPVAVAYEVDGNEFRRDTTGEVQHIEMNVEYRFSEPFGSTGLFAGVGFYRQTADDDAETENNYGLNAGVNADFPITRRYGFVLEGTYHWTRAPFQPRYMTVAGGLRLSF
ncbi:MAG: outer membrane beta-barrel protein [Thermoanaerobaculia bacterium]